VREQTEKAAEWKTENGYFSGPQNKNKNNAKITRENAMRILTGFNVSYLYME